MAWGESDNVGRPLYSPLQDVVGETGWNFASDLRVRPGSRMRR